MRQSINFVLGNVLLIDWFYNRLYIANLRSTFLPDRLRALNRQNIKINYLFRGCNYVTRRF